MDVLKETSDFVEVHVRLHNDAGQVADVARLIGIKIHKHQMLEACDWSDGAE